MTEKNPFESFWKKWRKEFKPRPNEKFDGSVISELFENFEYHFSELCEKQAKRYEKTIHNPACLEHKQCMRKENTETSRVYRLIAPKAIR